MTSRTLPPPMPAAAASSMNPVMSIRLREATSAPVTANTAVPNQSSARRNVPIMAAGCGEARAYASPGISTSR
jgi:hypothetical protein